MRMNVQRHVRKILRRNRDGSTVMDMARRLETRKSTVYNALKAMPDTYVLRWREYDKGCYEAVWSVVVPPENAPRPTKQGATT